MRNGEKLDHVSKSVNLCYMNLWWFQSKKILENAHNSSRPGYCATFCVHSNGCICCTLGYLDRYQGPLFEAISAIWPNQWLFGCFGIALFDCFVWGGGWTVKNHRIPCILTALKKEVVTFVVAACIMSIIARSTSVWLFFAMVAMVVRSTSLAMAIIESKKMSSLSLFNCFVILAWR